jgi:quercetin dioxygenase-like cupin family protein
MVIEDVAITPPAELTYPRLFAGPDGVSHFGEGRLPFQLTAFAPPAPPVPVAVTTATRCVFAHGHGGWDGGWHPAPARQFVFVLAGVIEVEVGDGEERRFAAGAVFLLEDTAGRGHRTRVVGADAALLAFAQLGD